MPIEHLIIDNLAWLRRKAHQYYDDNFDADDLASETIEKILLSKDKFDTRHNFRPWALTVMHNTFITQYNRRKCILFTPIDDAFSCASPYSAEQDMSISHIFSAIRECARKSVAIECVILSAKGFDYAEIAQMLSIPKGTVMSRISNGRKMLRNIIGQWRK